MKQRLGLHKHVLPILMMVDALDELYTDYEEILGAVVFDCRDINYQFLRDTGQAALHELQETNQKIKLPFDTCWFEFADEFGVFAVDFDYRVGASLEEIFEEKDAEYNSVSLGNLIEYKTYAGWSTWRESDELAPCRDGPFAEIRNGVRIDGVDGEVVPFICECNIRNELDAYRLRVGAELLAGILALMQDHLIATEIKPDEMAPLNKARAKKGRPPLDAETRVLSINMGAVRRVIKPAIGTHESPRVHWRRGHWRHLHRGSEFENQVWVSRCLVGDISKGFVHKDYRMTWRPPMLSTMRH